MLTKTSLGGLDRQHLPEKVRWLYTQITEWRGGDKSQQSHAPNTSSPELLGFGKGTKRRPYQESAPLRMTRVPEPERLGPGSAGSPGLATDGSRRSNLEPEQREQGGYTCHERGADPVWLRHCEHTPVLFVCSIPPYLPSARLNKLA